MKKKSVKKKIRPIRLQPIECNQFKKKSKKKSKKKENNKTHHINTSEYEFTYRPIKYKNNTISMDIELYRWISIDTLKQNILDTFNKYKIKPIKGDLKSNIDNMIARMLFDILSKDNIKKLDDGLLNFSDVSVLNDLNTTFNIEKNMIKPIYDELDIDGYIKIRLKTMKEMKKMPQKNQVKIYINNNKMTTEFLHNNKLHKIQIPFAVYDKLKKRYAEYPDQDNDLNELVACLCLRYDALGSIGNQMGIPIPIKDKLKDCRVNFEGFASALNHHCYYYCSMFYDIEKYFGSIGLYQNIKYIRGTFMLNPPYEKSLLHRMVSKIIKSLDVSKSDLCFLFGTPTWDSYKEITFHMDANESKYFKLKFRFDNYQVWWYDFIKEVYTKIPSSTRYILANYNMDTKCLQNAIKDWIELQV